MVINKTGGRKHKRSGKKNTHAGGVEEMPYKTLDSNYAYAVVLDKKGGNKLLVKRDDISTECLASIPGKFYKRVWVNKGDIILVNKDPLFGGNCEMIYKYNDKEVRQLRSQKLIDFEVQTMDDSSKSNILFGDEEQDIDDDDIFDKMDKEIEDAIENDNSDNSNENPNRQIKFETQVDDASAKPTREVLKNRAINKIVARNKKLDVEINDVPDSVANKDIDFDAL